MIVVVYTLKAIHYPTICKVEQAVRLKVNLHSNLPGHQRQRSSRTIKEAKGRREKKCTHNTKRCNNYRVLVIKNKKIRKKRIFFADLFGGSKKSSTFALAKRNDADVL